MVRSVRVIWYYEPTTVLAGIGAGTALLGGALDAGAAQAEGRDAQLDIDAAIQAEQLGTRRDIRDNRETLKVDVARARAVVASQGGNLSDAVFELSEGRIRTEANVREDRLLEDRDFTISNLLRRRMNVAKEAGRRGEASLLGGIGGAGTSLFRVFG